jgi:hypothetical protein
MRRRGGSRPLEFPEDTGVGGLGFSHRAQAIHLIAPASSRGSVGVGRAGSRSPYRCGEHLPIALGIAWCDVWQAMISGRSVVFRTTDVGTPVERRRSGRS